MVSSVTYLVVNFSIHSPVVCTTLSEIFRQVIHIAVVGDLRLMLGLTLMSLRKHSHSLYQSTHGEWIRHRRSAT